MIKSTLFFIATVVFWILTGTAVAQITINQSDMQSLVGNPYNVDSYETKSASDLTGIAALKGPNQTFDFTTISSFTKDYSGTIAYMNLPADVPGASDPDFTDANAVLKVNLTGVGQVTDSTLWAYLQITSDAANTAGFIYISQSDVDGDGKSPDTLKYSYNPYLLSTKLPLTYGTSWKDTTTSSISYGSTSLTQTVQVDAEVDGYGTLMLPNHSAECLRLNVMTTIISSYGGFQVATTNGTISYITKSGVPMSATIITDENGNPRGASYILPASGVPIEATPGQIAKNYRLDQNYPNPFNPSTVISYNLKSAGPVKLQIYNSLGQQVAILVNGTQAAGIHKITFNATGLNSGLYFYKLQTGSFVQTRKMMLIK